MGFFWCVFFFLNSFYTIKKKRYNLYQQTKGHFWLFEALLSAAYTMQEKRIRINCKLKMENAGS